MKIALGQTDIVWENPEKNIARIRRLAQQAAGRRADVLVLPELCTSGFTMNTAVAEPVKGASRTALAETAQKYGLTIISGLPVRTGKGRKAENRAVIFGRDGSVIAEYAKMHPFAYAGEDRSYRAGDAITIFDVEGVPACVFICYDLRFPEVFRAVAQHISLYFVIANWPASRKEHWEALLTARAIENQAFVIGVNRLGRDGNGVRYHGGSAVISPSGKILCSASSRPELILCDIDPADAGRLRSQFPFLKDMRWPL